jgi:HEAT repeat protein
LIQILKADSTTKAPAVDGELAASALGRIAPDTPLADDAVAALTEALRAESEYTRGYAAGALARFGPKAAGSIPRLRSLTNDRSRYVSTEAAKALATLDVAK